MSLKLFLLKFSSFCTNSVLIRFYSWQFQYVNCFLFALGLLVCLFLLCHIWYTGQNLSPSILSASTQVDVRLEYFLCLLLIVDCSPQNLIWLTYFSFGFWSPRECLQWEYVFRHSEYMSNIVLLRMKFGTYSWLLSLLVDSVVLKYFQLTLRVYML